MIPVCSHAKPEQDGGALRWLPVFFILLQDTLYGFGDPISKTAYAILPVFSLLTVRYCIALAFLLLVFGRRFLHGLQRCSWRDWIVPALCTGSAYVCGNIALGVTAATSVAFLRSLSTVLTPLLSAVIFRGKLDRKHIPVLLMVVVGLYLLCGLGGLSGFGRGEALALCAALFLSSSLIFGQRSLKRVDSVTLSVIQTTASAAMALVCAMVFDRGVHLEAATGAHWAVIVYLALACTVAGYLLQNAALGRISARTVSLLQCLCPVMTAFFSWLILGEKLSAAGILGAAILVSCAAAETIMMNRRRAQLPEKAAKTS